MPGEITATAPNTATKAKPYVCTTCTRPFARLEHLKRHERSHTKEKPFCCEQAGELPGCGRRFARRDLLLRHQQKIHLFPNTSKRRRMSSSATSNSTASSASKTTPPAEDLRLQYTMTMPNLDDMNNYTNGTVNPSSIFGSSPPASARSSRDSPSFSESSLPYNMSQADFTWATERLLPVDLMGASQPESVYSQQWQIPELTTLSSPGSSISSGSWSPQYDQSFMLNQPSALDMSGMPVENELYTQDFFVNNTTYQTPQRTSGNLTLQQIQAQFMQSQQMDYANTKPMVMNDPSYVTDTSLRMQFAPDMNYGFIPEQMAYGSYVETY